MALRWSSRVESVCWCQARATANGFYHMGAFRGCSHGTLRWIFSKDKQENNGLCLHVYKHERNLFHWAVHASVIKITFLGLLKSGEKVNFKENCWRLNENTQFSLKFPFEKKKSIEIFYKNWKKKFIWQKSFDWWKTLNKKERRCWQQRQVGYGEPSTAFTPCCSRTPPLM